MFLLMAWSLLKLHRPSAAAQSSKEAPQKVGDVPGQRWPRWDCGPVPHKGRLVSQALVLGEASYFS